MNKDILDSPASPIRLDKDLDPMDTPTTAAGSGSTPSTHAGQLGFQGSDRRTVAFSLPCGVQGHLQGECYQYTTERTKLTQARCFWHMRWIVDFLGGHQSRNFLSGSVSTFKNKVFEILWPRWDQSDEQGLKEEVDLHVCMSSFSELQKLRTMKMKDTKKRKATFQNPEETCMDNSEDEHEAVPGQVQADGQAGSKRVSEFATSTFATLVLLFHWQHSMRKDSKWNKDTKTVSAVARSLLEAFVSQFLEDHTSYFPWEDNRLGLRFRQGALDVKELIQHCPHLVNTLSPTRCRFVDIMDDLMVDIAKRTLSMKRTGACLKLRSFMLETLAEAVETSDRTHSCWTSLNLKQIMQLRRPFQFWVLSGSSK